MAAWSAARQFVSGAKGAHSGRATAPESRGSRERSSRPGQNARPLIGPRAERAFRSSPRAEDARRTAKCGVFAAGELTYFGTKQ